MRKLTKTAITVAAMATMMLGTVASIQADEKKNGWVGSGTNYEYYINGTKQLNKWVEANGKWYFLDEEGKMATKSFIRTDAFTNESEVLDKNDVDDLINSDDIDDDSKFYYVDANGIMVSGWQAINASSVYLSPNSTGNTNIWYYFGSTGAMYTNAWILSGEDWYAVGENGQMYTNEVLKGNLKDDSGKDYFVDGNGKMIRGWYKTTATDKSKGEFYDKGLYIYADNDGVLAKNEWIHDNSGWYYVGINADSEDGDLEVKVYETKLSSLNAEANITSELGDEYERYIPKDDNNDNGKNFVMLTNKVIQWTNHKKDTTKYFYLRDNGAMVSGWYEFEDDYYVCGNGSGELYIDAVESVNGKYYYFNENAICDYKYINVIADYAVKLPDKSFIFYNTDGKNIGSDTSIIDCKISEMRDSLTEDEYIFGSRKVKKNSMTDIQVISAYAAQDTGTFNEELTIYKLRSSATTKATVKTSSDATAAEIEKINAYLVKDSSKIVKATTEAKVATGGTITTVSKDDAIKTNSRISYSVKLKEKIEGENIGAQLELKFDTEATVKLVSTTSGAKVYKTLDSENGLQNLIGTGKELTLDSNNSSILYVDKNAEYVFSVITKEYGKNTVTQTIVIKVE